MAKVKRQKKTGIVHCRVSGDIDAWLSKLEYDTGRTRSSIVHELLHRTCHGKRVAK